MKNKEYWEARAIAKDKLLEKDIKKIEKKILKHFKDTRKEVINELKIIYADIESTEWAKYRIDSLLTSVNRELDNLYHKNEELLTKAFIDLYNDMSEEASIDLNIAFTKINEKLVEEVIKTNWSGLTFSERIWEHRRRLAITIKEELNKGLTRGDSLQTMARIVADKFNTSFSNAMRLVHTESAWVMNQATLDNYKENDVKEYEFMAFLDKRTSPQCKGMNGEVIKIEDVKAGINLPPLHPY
ncbi:MAG: minor capsid protein [Cetobacterium sp.]